MISSQTDKVDVWFPPSVVWEIKGADFQVNNLLILAISCLYLWNSISRSQ